MKISFVSTEKREQMMATCKDCIHYQMCHSVDIEAPCVAFKNKADYAEVKHGEWIHSSRGFDVSGDYECSICHSPSGIKHFYNGSRYLFCPDCGAKMDGGVTNDLC